MTPRWGLKVQERRRLTIKMSRQGHRPAFQEIAHKFVAHLAPTLLTIARSVAGWSSCRSRLQRKKLAFRNVLEVAVVGLLCCRYFLPLD
ncbi:MAG: hypothetical protein DMG06_27245 [Acidobacteria bacterium]|nr:MAG: hypothetical protein DMG06_27245 [Acidobacteriota bacterium]